GSEEGSAGGGGATRGGITVEAKAKRILCE
ncbi:hypothetical protein A2U01_0075828, partial [Trifolium medium]|nr:hypothetical protein [Trifolium medium]